MSSKPQDLCLPGSSPCEPDNGAFPPLPSIQCRSPSAIFFSKGNNLSGSGTWLFCSPDFENRSVLNKLQTVGLRSEVWDF